MPIVKPSALTSDQSLGVTFMKPDPRTGRGIALLACFFGLRILAGGQPLISASILGGSQFDAARAMATDLAGNIYVVGETYSNDFPGAGQSGHSRAAGDAFIVKLNGSATQILYSFVFGGTNYDSARSVAIDSSGNAYITGLTGSVDFPVTAGALQQSSPSPGLQHAFIVKVSSSGSLIYASYLGGASNDAGYAIAVDPSGAAYVAGSTSSPNFPVTLNAPQKLQRGISNCFVAKVDPSGASLLYATFLGGERNDLCRGIAVDGAGEAYVTGVTNSASFPLATPLDSALSGSSDAFLTKLSSAGNQLLFSTYLGGESVDEGNAVAVGPNGVVYIAGDTASSAFPVSPNALQPSNRGGYDAFLCAMAGDGSQLVWSTYLGGSGSDSADSVAVALDGRIVVAGYTASVNFPVVGAIQSAFGGAFDAFAAVVKSNGTALDFSTFIGGGGDDRAYGVAALGPDQFALCGQVLSGSVPYIRTQFSSTPAGQDDTLIAAIAYAASTPTPLRFVPVTPCRVADTRAWAGFTGNFGPPSLVGAGIRTFPIPSSNCGIPITAQAYSLNVTVLPSGQLHYLTLWPAGQSLPNVSTINSDGRIKANAAIVLAGISGAVSVFASDPTDLVLDINGYFVDANSTSALAFYPLPLCRAADTRTASGALGGPALAGKTARTFPLLAAGCGVPATAQAYLLNFTAYPRGELDYITTWPAGQAQPNASTLNDKVGIANSAAAILPAGAMGAISVFASNDTDLSIDIDGYFAPSGSGGLSFYAAAPCRVLDTRYPWLQPPLPGGVVRLAPVASSVCAPPATAQAYVLNSTVVPSGPLQYLNLWGQGMPVPSLPLLTAPDRAVTSNMAIVAAPNGSVEALPSDPTHLILDLIGYFAP